MTENLAAVLTAKPSQHMQTKTENRALEKSEVSAQQRSKTSSKDHREHEKVAKW